MTIKAFGVTVATIEVPEYGITLEGKEVSGVLLSLPEIDREKLDQMVASAKEKLAEMQERAKVVWGKFESMFIEELARMASLLGAFAWF